MKALFLTVLRLACLLPAWAALAAPSPDPPPGTFTGKLLVAHERIADPRFMHSVLLVIRHGAEGCMALMINHPTRRNLGEIFPGSPGAQASRELMHIGGPLNVGRLLFLISEPEDRPLAGTRRILKGLFFGTDPTLLDTLKPPVRIRAYAGYAGWAAGQLEHELRRGDWYLADATVPIVFEQGAAGLWRQLHEQVRGQQVVGVDAGATQGTRPGAVAGATSWTHQMTNHGSEGETGE